MRRFGISHRLVLFPLCTFDRGTDADRAFPFSSGSTAGEAAWPAEPCPGSRGVAGVGERVSWLG